MVISDLTETLSTGTRKELRAFITSITAKTDHPQVLTSQASPGKNQSEGGFLDGPQGSQVQSLVEEPRNKILHATTRTSHATAGTQQPDQIYKKYSFFKKPHETR